MPGAFFQAKVHFYIFLRKRWPCWHLPAAGGTDAKGAKQSLAVHAGVHVVPLAGSRTALAKQHTCLSDAASQVSI
jgi:hypothetical protein